MVNPATGEIGYALKDKATRLIQLSLFDERDSARDLPSVGAKKSISRIGINIQPSKGHRKFEDALKNAWDEGRVNYVKCQGGSPALALLEAAKGHHVYMAGNPVHPL